VLSGEPGPKRSAVLLNAGASIAAAGLCETIADGVQRAAALIDSGAALAKVDALVAASRAQKQLAAGGAP
jgi:anthranilate phosphoribosyltransferase